MAMLLGVIMPLRARLTLSALVLCTGVSMPLRVATGLRGGTGMVWHRAWQQACVGVHAWFGAARGNRPAREDKFALPHSVRHVRGLVGPTHLLHAQHISAPG